MYFSKIAGQILFSLALLASLLLISGQQKNAIAAEIKNETQKQATKTNPKNALGNIKKEQYSKSELERNLSRLDNLYVPIHWADYTNGLAIGGFDPIAYFETKSAIIGENDFQLVWHGVSWQFVSSGNLQAFKRTPAIYAPQYAGYDPYAISNGILTEGQPSIWAIINGRLYLFYSEVNRYLWQENKNDLKQITAKNWDKLALDLPRYKISGN